MNPARAADLAVLADTPLPDGRDVLVRAVDGDVRILGHVPNGATVHLDDREMQGGWLDLPDETAEAVVAALTRVATDPQFAAQGAELSMRQAQDIAATLHVDGISSPAAPGALVLSDSERKALVAGLIYQAEQRDPGFDFDEWEIYADLASDPTYFGDERATDAYVERERRSYNAFAERAAALGRPFTDLAEQVERTGRLDLTDPSTWNLVNDSVDDCAVRNDPEAQSEWRRIVEAVDAHSPQDRADAAGTWDAASRASTIAQQTGNTVDDSIAEAAFTDARVAASSLGPVRTIGVSGSPAMRVAPLPTVRDPRTAQRSNQARVNEIVRMTETLRREQHTPARRSERYLPQEQPAQQPRIGEL